MPEQTDLIKKIRDFELLKTYLEDELIKSPPNSIRQQRFISRLVSCLKVLEVYNKKLKRSHPQTRRE